MMIMLITVSDLICMNHSKLSCLSSVELWSGKCRKNRRLRVQSVSLVPRNVRNESSAASSSSQQIDLEQHEAGQQTGTNPR